MPTRIGGLPAHALLVHLAVVLVPVAALLVVLSGWWPAARRRLGLATPAAALLALAVVPVTTRAGEWLQQRLPASRLIQRHASLGHGLLPWVAGLAAVAVAVSVLDRVAGRRAVTDVQVSGRTRMPAGQHARSGPGRGVAESRRSGPLLAASLLLAVLALVAATGSTVQVYRIGDSGAHAVWDGVGTGPPPGG